MSYEACLLKYKRMEQKIPAAKKEKLDFLKFSIKNFNNQEIEIDTEKYPNLDISEIEALFRLPLENQKQLFCNELSSINDEEDSIIQGDLHSRGETIGRWNPKKLELNLTAKRLKVFRNEGIVDMDLRKYGVSWKGPKTEKSKHHAFTLVALNQRNFDHYKVLTLGSDDASYAKQWYQWVLKACDNRPAPDRRASADLSITTPPLQLNKSQEIEHPQKERKSAEVKVGLASEVRTAVQQFESIAESPELSKSKLQVPSSKSPRDYTQVSKTSTENLKPKNEPKASNSSEKKPLVRPEFQGMPEYLADLSLNRFQEGKFHRVANNIYKSISKPHLYQSQFELDCDFEEALAMMCTDSTWNRYLVDEQPFLELENYVIVKQKRRFQFQDQTLYFLRFKGIDTLYEKQLNEQDPMFNILKFFKEGEKVVVQMLSYIKADFLLFQNEIAYLKEYQNINSHRQYLKRFKSLDFERVAVLNDYEEEADDDSSSSQSSHKSETLMQEPRSIQGQRPIMTFAEILKFVEQNHHWSFALSGRVFPSTPKVVEVPKLQRSGANGHFLFKYQWKVDTKSGGLLYVDEQGLKEQKKVFSYLMSKIGGNLLEGKSITNISLPVYVFEKQSNLSRYASTLAYLQYLDQAVGLPAQQQIKQVLPYAYTTVILYINMQKPFNPILGETYQGYINGCPVYAEQVSHHPPISNLVLYGRGYKVYQRLCTLANISANSVTGINQGYTRIQFDDGNDYYFIPCPATYYGTIYGDKLFQLTGKFHLIDLNNRQVAEVKMNPVPSSMWKRSREHLDDYFEGYICSVNEEFVKRYRKEGFLKYKELKQQEIVTQQNKVHGVWHRDMFIDNEQMWNINFEPYVMEDEEYPIASDANWREDLLAWRMDDFDLAMRLKTKLEEIQRADAKLRKTKH